MEYWLAWIQEGNEQIREIAVAAEQMGFTGIAVADHVTIPKSYESLHPSGRRPLFENSNFPDPFITFATMAAVTTRLRFMTYVYILPMREPFGVAKQVATLAMQSGYRFNFGVGAGWLQEEFTLMGQDPRNRGARMDEMLAILRDLWDDGMAEFQGSHYRFAATGEAPVPTGRIPVWVGGDSPAALRRAARHDGWLGMTPALDELSRVIGTLREERRRLAESGAAVAEDFQIMGIAPPNATADDLRRMEEAGIRALLVSAWPVQRGAIGPLQPKLDAMEAFARRLSLRPGT